jgi:hypothetical protein
MAVPSSEIGAESKANEHVLDPVSEAETQVRAEERPLRHVSLEPCFGERARLQIGGSWKRPALTHELRLPRNGVVPVERFVLAIGLLPREVDADAQVRVEPDVAKELILLTDCQVARAERVTGRAVLRPTVDLDEARRVVSGGRCDAAVDLGLEVIGPVPAKGGSDEPYLVDPVVVGLSKGEEADQGLRRSVPLAAKRALMFPIVLPTNADRSILGLAIVASPSVCALLPEELTERCAMADSVVYSEGFTEFPPRPGL